MDAARVSPELQLARVPFGHPDALRLIAEVQQEYVARYGGEDETPLDPVMFDPPRGSFFVAYLHGRAVASGAWRRRGDVAALGSTQTAEVKRMYVAPGGSPGGCSPTSSRPRPAPARRWRSWRPA